MIRGPLAKRYEAARRALEGVDQAHALKFYDQLDDAQKEELLGQIEDIDWPEVARLVRSHVLEKPKFELPANLAPAPWYANVPKPGQKGKYEQARALGQELLREGKVAAFTVAGGQGTRLGWDAPKGTFPATPIRGLSLFASMSEYLRNAGQRFGRAIPWYIMTSPVNHAATRDYFKEQNHLGLGAENVRLFPQAMMPAIDMQTGKVLLETPSSLALSPNGHGGSLKALYTSGAIAEMLSRGIEQISYTQVDNPIVRVVDPVFLGLHAGDRCEMSSKMLPKAYPKEKLGNFCLVDGRMTVIEYSDLPDELAEQRLPDGALRFKAGSIAIHALRADFVESLNNKPGAGGSPCRSTGRRRRSLTLIWPPASRVEPKSNNAVKLETFVFDALPLCQRSIIYETDRLDEFAPIKNADGPHVSPRGGSGIPAASSKESGVDAASTAAPPVVDSPQSSKDRQTERAARWLEMSGVKVPRDAKGKPEAVIEISQLTAIYPEDLKSIKLPDAIERGEKTVL